MTKILIVDDSDSLRGDLRKILTSEGFTVVEGNDGTAGLQALRSNPDVKVILSDQNMPTMDGLTMCETIKSQAISTAPIIMLTTEASLTLKERAKACGVRAWVTKPYVPDKLVAGVKKLSGS